MTWWGHIRAELSDGFSCFGEAAFTFCAMLFAKKVGPGLYQWRGAFWRIGE